MSGQPWRDNLHFFTAFLRRPRTVGAVLPSSRHLADLLVGPLHLQAGDLVVEFGPGTGPMTAVIHSRLPPGVDYLGIERSPAFQELLTRRFPGLRFHCGSADRLEDILAGNGLPRPRRIISGLPFASLPRPAQDGIIRGVARTLADDGEFRTFQYTHAYWFPAARRFRAAMAGRFGRFRRLGPVFRNVPPAWVLSYQR